MLRWAQHDISVCQTHGMFKIVLVEPEIPPNTGNIIRLAANTGCALHLIEPLGFELSDYHLRRAGLDYHEYTALKTHANWAAFCDNEKPNLQRCFAFTTKGSRGFHSVNFQAGDYFIFGSETKGLANELRESFPPEQRLRLPMREGQRSLNLSNTVAIAVFEAWRQCGFEDGS
jgi:tRNA (cytidine/uridine-2'-O-)-methyltransferase